MKVVSVAAVTFAIGALWACAGEVRVNQQTPAPVTPAATATPEQRDAAEGQAIRDAVTVCNEGDDATCKAKCNAENDTNYCVAWAWKLRQRNLIPAPLVEERTYLKKACDGGNQSACKIVPVIEQQIDAADNERRAAEARERIATARSGPPRVDVLWDDVNVGAIKLLFGEVGRDLVPQTEAQHRKAVIDQWFCPAKKAFISEFGSAEYAKRAADYCNSPPENGSLRRANQAQCRAVLAIGCP